MSKKHLHIMVDDEVHVLLKVHVENNSELINDFLKLYLMKYRSNNIKSEKQIEELNKQSDDLISDIVAKESELKKIKDKHIMITMQIANHALKKKQQAKQTLKKGIALLDGVVNARLHDR